MIPTVFLSWAAYVLADTTDGLSAGQIASITSAFAVDHGVDLPHPSAPFRAPNKRTALLDNLRRFDPSQQYKLLRILSDHESVRHPDKIKLKRKLALEFGHLGGGPALDDLNRALVDDTRHWLDPFPRALELYLDALEKYDRGTFSRNVLDDLRLALEMLLQEILNNKKSLENQIAHVGAAIREASGSPELVNMFLKLLDYYAKYQNTYVKHDDAVVETEVEFVIEITSTFMKQLVRVLHKA